MAENVRKKAISQKLHDLFAVLGKIDADNDFVVVDKIEVKSSFGNVLEISDNIKVPEISIPESFWTYKSPLTSDFLPMGEFSLIIKSVIEMSGKIRLNHVGFCYPISNYEQEHKRIVDSVKNSKWSLFEEVDPSGNPPYRFLGNLEKWDDPMIELVPVDGNVSDKWKDYWLPHIQIDFDTHLLEDEINEISVKISKGRIQPYKLIVNNEQTLVVRLWLGTVSGMNFYLDLGTEARMTRFYRKRMLKRI